MGLRAHVQTKHEIEYGRCHFNWCQEEIYGWLVDNGVSVYTDQEHCLEYANDWEVEKSTLKNIPESAYAPIGEGDDDEISADELREFVADLLAAPTGEYAYVSWY